MLAASPEERRSTLHSYIEPTADDISQGRRTPTKAHRAIAWFVLEGFVGVVVTTNFDRLLENAMREAGVEPTIIRSDDDLLGAIPLTHSRCFLLKLHGDYLDTRIKNNDEELASYSAPLDGLLDRILDEHGLIVCGWSGDWDHALRAAITRAPNRRYPTFWAARGVVSDKANDLIKQRAAKVIQIVDADTFFTDLQQKLAAQVESQPTHPRSTELLVAMAKRYVGRAEFRVQLNLFRDIFPAARCVLLICFFSTTNTPQLAAGIFYLLSDEYRRLQTRLDEANFNAQGQFSVEEFRHRVARYEAAADPLARVLGVIGRWGDQLTDSLACDILSDLARLRVEGGFQAWLDFRLYPAVLLFYAYGLRVLKSARLDVLFYWFTQVLRTEGSKEGAAVDQLLLVAWGAAQITTGS
jgi:hypothetical protein